MPVPSSLCGLQAEYSDGGLFAVGPEYGFLPKCSPLRSLPERYAALDELLQRLPVWTDFAKGERGILANKGDIVQYVHDLPDYTDEVCRVGESRKARQVQFEQHHACTRIQKGRRARKEREKAANMYIYDLMPTNHGR